jgi:Glycosyltransferase family 17
MKSQRFPSRQRSLLRYCSLALLLGCLVLTSIAAYYSVTQASTTTTDHMEYIHLLRYFDAISTATTRDVDSTAQVVTVQTSFWSSSSAASSSSSSMVRDVLSQNVTHGGTAGSTFSYTNIGIVSYRDLSFFRAIQSEIDKRDPIQRCLEYGFRYDSTKNIHRRIFFGALIADESWELLDILSTEAYGIFAGIVLVESNRTQNLTPRKFRHLNDSALISQMFGTTVQIRPYLDEHRNKFFLEYEHAQRQEILYGWKDIGMLPEDVGLLADMDEIFTRDFLRAAQTCDNIDLFTYKDENPTNATDEKGHVATTFSGHSCQHQYTKLIGLASVFESTPECITAKRNWHHPDMILGHCIEGIGEHPPAPRDRQYPLKRSKGFGEKCKEWDGEDAIIDPKKYPSWNAGDFRRTCGGRMVAREKTNFPLFFKASNSPYTAYHFHNFFIHFNQTRFKYRTYGHPDVNAATKNIEDMSSDLQMMYRCVKNVRDDPNQKWKRIVGGYKAALPFQPIYFHDEHYRRRRHLHVQSMIEQDDIIVQKLQANYQPGQKGTLIYTEIKS